MRQNLGFVLAPGQMSSEAAQHIPPTAVYARLINHATQCQQSVEECCNDLLTLTLLVPSAPWVSVVLGRLERDCFRTILNASQNATFS